MLTLSDVHSMRCLRIVFMEVFASRLLFELPIHAVDQRTKDFASTALDCTRARRGANVIESSRRWGWSASLAGQAVSRTIVVRDQRDVAAFAHDRLPLG